MIIAIDFDGTIIQPCKYPELHYSLMPHCREVLDRLAENNTLVLCTARYGWYYIYCVLWIKFNKLPIHISAHRKPVADVYIDDHNIFCKEIDWHTIEKELAGGGGSVCIM